MRTLIDYDGIFTAKAQRGRSVSWSFLESTEQRETMERAEKKISLRFSASPLRLCGEQSFGCFFVAFLITALIISTSAFAQDTSKVDAIFAAYDQPDSPGCALGIIKDGKLIYTRGYGRANLEHGIANGSQIVYDIGSTSKQFAAASILLLARQGKLSLDDDVRKLIPELPAYQKPVTIRHMLNHTSGLRDYLTLFSLAGVDFDSTTGDKEALNIIVRQKQLNFAPGDDWLYSNSGFLLLSQIVKRASGKTLAQFAKENIFDPLGMKHTHFHDNHTMIVPKRATGYAPAQSGFRIAMSNFEQTGDGAVYTTLEDLLLWDQNFYQPKVGGQAMLDQLQTLGVLNNGKKLDYALGLFVDEYKGLRRVHHGGSWAGYRAEMMRFPDQKFTVACLCNLATANPTNLATKVADIYLANEFKASEEKTPATAIASTITLTEEQLKDKVGLYRFAETGEFRRITLRDGKLWIDGSGLKASLMPLTPNRFRAGPGAEVTFEKSANGKWTLKRSRNNQEDAFEKVEAFAPTAQQLAEFTGSYYSEELDTTWRLTVENEKLTAIDRNEQKIALTPTFRDAFTGRFQAEFSRNAQGQVSGFVIHAGRIRQVKFVKR
jgi:CubicO group peptidase (beta-lactamase class C family)